MGWLIPGHSVRSRCVCTVLNVTRYMNPIMNLTAPCWRVCGGIWSMRHSEIGVVSAPKFGKCDSNSASPVQCVVSNLLPWR